MTITIPAIGSRHSVPVLTGYVYHQNRPFTCSAWRPSKLHPGQYTSDCEGACGGNCNGATTHYPGTVTNVIYWADNSIDVEVRCDDGITRRDLIVSPHGDIC